MAYRPLADEIRPQTLDEVVGQSHILGKDGLLRRIVDSGKIPNLIFYGPSGTGKTTVANIIAQRTNRPLHRLNATTASISDIKDITADIGTLMAPEGVLLYRMRSSTSTEAAAVPAGVHGGWPDHPHRLYHREPLLRRLWGGALPGHRVRVQADYRQEVLPAVDRGIAIMGERLGGEVVCEDGVREHIASACGGDVRKAMKRRGAAPQLKLSQEGARENPCHLEDARTVAQKSAMRYDREGDSHFDIASALMKSLRGSDPDAALHYLARLLEAGDLITAIRRILCSASEDIGLAYPMAVPIVKACVDNALQLGLPEARLPLSEAVILLATAPKSNTACMAIDAAIADVRAGKVGDIPRELQNVHADSAGLEREQGYLYPHSFPNHWVHQQYLPDELVGTRYYQYGDNKTEQAARRYWEEIKKT